MTPDPNLLARVAFCGHSVFVLAFALCEERLNRLAVLLSERFFARTVHITPDHPPLQAWRTDGSGEFALRFYFR
jgi:hypothetical protein